MGLFCEHAMERGPDADSIAGEAIITNTIDLRGDGLLVFHCCCRLIR